MMVLTPITWNRCVILFTIFKYRIKINKHYSKLRGVPYRFVSESQSMSFDNGNTGAVVFLYFLSHLSGIEQTTS